MVKLDDTQEDVDEAGASAAKGKAGAPGHFDFRDAYFRKFPERATEAGGNGDLASSQV